MYRVILRVESLCDSVIIYIIERHARSGSIIVRAGQNYYCDFNPKKIEKNYEKTTNIFEKTLDKQKLK